MSVTSKIGSQAILRLVDAEVLKPRDTHGAEDLDATSYLKVTANQSATEDQDTVSIEAANDDQDDVSLEIAPKGSGTLIISGLPTSDPGVAGQLWSDSGAVKVSAGA